MNVELLIERLAHAVESIRTAKKQLEREQNPQLDGCIAQLGHARQVVAGVLIAVESIERSYQETGKRP